MNDDRAYAISAANLQTLERNLNYLANNMDSVDIKVVDVNEKVNKVNEEVKNINANIKELISEIRQTTILTNAKQSISLGQDEINKKYGHYDNIRRQISGLFQALEVGSIDQKSIKELKEKAIVNAPNYWLSSAFVAICAWINNNQKEATSALKDAISKDDEKTSLFFSLINLKFEKYDSSFKWLRRYLDIIDSSKMESKIVPLLDALTNGMFDSNEKKYFLDKIFTWTNDLHNKTNYKNIQINRWIDFLVTLLGDNNYDEYYYIKKYTNKYDDINRLTNINIAQNNIYNYFNDIVDEKETISLDKKAQIDKIINLLIYNYENEELDIRKEIAQNKLIVEEEGNTLKARERFKDTEFAYLKNTDFYSILSNIILQSDELKPSINTKKLSLSILKNIILASYDKLNENEIDNMNITIKIGSWSDTTTDGKNENELISSLKNHIEKEESVKINSVKLFDVKMLFTTLFGLIFSIVLFILNQSLLGIVVILLTFGIVVYSFIQNFKIKDIKIKEKDKRFNEEKNLLINIIAEIVDFKLIYKDGNDIKNKINNLIKSLDYNNYIKTNDTRNINIENKDKIINNETDIFDSDKPKSKINYPSWDLIPPYDDKVVNRI